MALLRIESFDVVPEALLATSWTGGYSNSGGSIGPGSGRTGQGLAMRASAGYFAQNFGSPVATMVLGAWLRINTFVNSGTEPLVRLMGVWDAGTCQCWLGIHEPTKVLRIYRGLGSGTLLASSSALWNAGDAHYLELLCTPHPTTGLVQVVVDGALWATYTGNTRASANSTANLARFNWQGEATPPGEWNSDWDDVYVGDTRVGDLRVFALLPNGAGDLAAWTPTGAATNWQAAADGTDGSYVAAVASGAKDLYALTDLPTPDAQQVLAAQSVFQARKLDAGARAAGLLVSSGGTQASTTPFTLSTSAAYYWRLLATNPATGLPWAASAFAALQLGPELP